MTKKIKRLSPEARRDLEAKNETRRVHGLRALEVKVRSCLACGALFESLGNRTCGCLKNAYGGSGGLGGS